MADKIQVMIVDDHPVFRQGLRNVLAAHEDLNIVGEDKNTTIVKSSTGFMI